jgi:hypothetical protein
LNFLSPFGDSIAAKFADFKNSMTGCPSLRYFNYYLIIEIEA